MKHGCSRAKPPSTSAARVLASTSPTPSRRRRASALCHSSFGTRADSPARASLVHRGCARDCASACAWMVQTDLIRRHSQLSEDAERDENARLPTVPRHARALSARVSTKAWHRSQCCSNNCVSRARRSLASANTVALPTQWTRA